jgi:hypothetical protein
VDAGNVGVYPLDFLLVDHDPGIIVLHSIAMKSALTRVCGTTGLLICVCGGCAELWNHDDFQVADRAGRVATSATGRTTQFIGVWQVTAGHAWPALEAVDWHVICFE